MSDKIIVLEDGVLKYYSGNNPAITEDPWASSRISCIENDQLIRDVENIDITISAEISKIAHPHSLNQFSPISISVDKDNIDILNERITKLGYQVSEEFVKNEHKWNFEEDFMKKSEPYKMLKNTGFDVRA